VRARGERRPALWSPLEALVGGVMEKLGREELAKLCAMAAVAIRTNPEGSARAADRLAVAMRASAPVAAAK
jgi:hypothetical protein